MTPREAIALQRRLSSRVERSTRLDRPIRLIAGVDASCQRFSRQLHIGAVLWDVETGQIVESAQVSARTEFPYIPGLLSFREAPGIIDAIGRLTIRPDLLMVDGVGWAHPRRLGIACHLGVVLDLPTIGCAKSRLIGVHREPGARRGASTRLRDRGETVGRVLRTKPRCQPMYISIGHRVDLDDAVRWVLRAGRGRRLPEPTRLAHECAHQARRRHERTGDLPSANQRLGE